MDRRAWIVAAALPLLALVGWLTFAGSDAMPVHAALGPGHDTERGEPQARKLDLALETPPQTRAGAREAGTRPTRPIPAQRERRSDARLDVRVVDGRTNEALADVRVTAYAESPLHAALNAPTDDMLGSLTRSPLTDADGRATFSLPPAVDLRLSVQGSRARRTSLRVPRLAARELREVVVRLESGEHVAWHGVVRDKASGAPIPGAELRFTPTPTDDSTSTPWMIGGRPDALSGPTGGFMLQRPTWTRAQVQVDARGFGPSTFLLAVDHADASAPRVVWLEEAASARILVVDALQRPRPDVAVLLATSAVGLAQTESEVLLAPAATWSVATDAHGVAQFANLPPRVPLTVALASGAATTAPPLPLELEPGGAQTRTLELAGGTRVHGRLARAGGAVEADAELWLVPADERRARHLLANVAEDVVLRVRTDADGSYELPTVPPGLWWLGPAPVGPRAPLARCIEIPAHLGSLELDLRAVAARDLEGAVCDAGGTPAPGAALYARALASGERFTFETDTAGRFALGPLAAGTYEVGVFPGADHAGAPPVLVAAGGAPLDFALRSGACLDGVAVDDAGALVDIFAQVLVTDSAGRVRARSGADARLAIDGLDDGAFLVAARDDAGRCGTVAVETSAGAAPAVFVLRLVPGAALELVGPEHGAPARWRAFAGDACVAAGNVEAGRIAHTVVPAGKLRIEWRRKTAVEVREFTLEVDPIRGARAAHRDARLP